MESALACTGVRHIARVAGMHGQRQALCVRFLRDRREEGGVERLKTREAAPDSRIALMQSTWSVLSASTCWRAPRRIWEFG